ncbi:uncharacterized protein LOC105702982 isoform X2 [Orussus abietinus]|uniref:uncharacterized protein LOC105702982 isoform X2 n=1 Tax=Orussus abietinus TaxID=222816 RepID=UPI000625506F|nr:uncharacterized protein LOC105702982 isoform X2 [Orussus abietinus]
MSNPYRGHQYKPRDHASASSYRMFSQNQCGPAIPTVQGDLQSSATFQHLSPVVNQQQQQPQHLQQQCYNDPWDWGSDAQNNGNDSWNWSVDQQSDPKQQQQQQQQQQKHPQQQQQQQQQQQPQTFLPPYSSHSQVPSNSIQENYYKNQNGNNRPPVITQHSSSGRSTPKIHASGEPISNHAGPYNRYTNYSFNPQYSAPPRPNSAKSTSESNDRSQWSNDQQSQNIHVQQKSAVHEQNTRTPPLSEMNSYNWSNDKQSVHPGQQDWQNHLDSTTSGYRHTVNANLGQEGQNEDNLIHQGMNQVPSQYQIPLSYMSRSDSMNNDVSTWSNSGQQECNVPNYWSNQSMVTSNQWPNQQGDNFLVNQSQVYQSGSNESTWDPSKDPNISQKWPQSNLSSASRVDQWMQQKIESNDALTSNILHEDISNKVVTSDWQQIKPPSSHFTSSTSTTSGSASTKSNSIERQDSTGQDEPSKLVYAQMTNEPLDDGKTIEDTLKDSIDCDAHFAMKSQMNAVSSNLENVLQNAEDKWNVTRDWGTVPASELSNVFGQLNIGHKLETNVEGPVPNFEEHIASQHPASSEWSSQLTSDSEIISDNFTSENISTIPSGHASGSDHTSLVESQPPVIQERVLPEATHQPNASNIMDNTSRGGYDQWYNQNVHKQPGNEWRVNEQVQPMKQWSPEQDVENSENIQQSSDFINLETVTAGSQAHDVYQSNDSVNREDINKEGKSTGSVIKEGTSSNDIQQETNEIEISSTQPVQSVPAQPHQVEQTSDSYEFSSNDRNTFLETGELTDSHQEHELTPPNQDDENDEVPNDIPFLREVPGQSSSADPRRNDPTGQEQYVLNTSRVSDPRRNDPSGQEQNTQNRNVPDRADRRDVPPGQERNISLASRGDSDTLERRNDPSGRERSLPPQQSRNDPSGEERILSIPQVSLQPSETREVPGRGNEPEEIVQQVDSEVRQIPGGASPSDVEQMTDDWFPSGSQEVMPPVSLSTIQDQPTDVRNKRAQAVGASMGEGQPITATPNRRDSYEDGDDEGSGNSREESRDRRRDASPERRHYDYDRKGSYYDREREYDDDYYYDRRRGADYDRAYNSREDLDRREPYRDDDRRHPSRDDLDRHGRDDIDRRGRIKDDLEKRDSRRRVDERRRVDDTRRREPREFDPRFPRDREYPDRDRDRRRDDRRGRRYNDFESRDQYRREYYDDPYGRSSRPSSRSSYNDRDRDYYMRNRDPYYGYNGYGGYDYGANYYAYLENLRRTDPAAYAEWYHKYYSSQQQHQQQIPRGVASFPEDRASVHSGRSSCDERTTGDKRALGDTSLLEDSRTASARMTPTKFSTSHVYGSFSIGSLLHVHASYPADGERAKVDILRVENLLLHDPVARELRAYPGPLIKGVTHKKTIIEYCEAKISKAAANEEMDDRASYILLYQLMIMLIQQNGNVVGVDIASLLLRNKDAYPYELNKHVSRRESVMSQRTGGTGTDGNLNDTTQTFEKSEDVKRRKTVERVTDEFRNTLLCGLVQEALEFAMNEGLWGHALFLASKLDKRTHASVMTRFANSLPAQDPLQTLYQLHSGRVPSSVTCVSDPKWDDWRPHLAMIISNTSANPEINRKSITTLGDTLATRGNIHAAHFCYILSQIDFCSYNTTSGKLVLIGSNHHKPYAEFVTTEAIMLTEIYEYARNLSEPGFSLVELQTFKFELAVKMIDYGLMEKALLYIEQIAVNISNSPSKYKKSFIEEVYTLGDRIKYQDPVFKDSEEDPANLAWLDNLAEIVCKCQAGEIIQDDARSHVTTDLHTAVQGQDRNEFQQQHQKWITAQPDYSEGSVSLMEVPPVDSQSDWQPMSLPTNPQDPYTMNTPSTQFAGSGIETNHYQQQSQPQQSYWEPPPYHQQEYTTQEYSSNEWQQQSSAQYQSEQPDLDNAQDPGNWNYESETEEKSATSEVSNPTLASSNTLNQKWLTETSTASSLRRRKVPSKPETRTSSEPTSGSDPVQTTVPPKVDTPDLHTVSKEKSQRPIKYPKIMSAYPPILSNKKINHKDPPKPRKIDPTIVRPPPSRPPVFLKCKVPEKNEEQFSKESTEREPENVESVTAKETTDLDIQFSKLKLDSFTPPDSSTKTEKRLIVAPKSNNQTFTQYCSFEEKKVVRVAPHIRRKDVICDTVDAWSDVNGGQNVAEVTRYKPLVFGGTYPIDVPLRGRTIGRVEQTRVIDATARHSAKTFDIDAPMNYK